MSTKHPPITGELRAAMEHAEGARDGRAHRTCEARRFERLCDGIDAVHRGLEHELARLRVDLQRARRDRDAMARALDEALGRMGGE